MTPFRQVWGMPILVTVVSYTFFGIAAIVFARRTIPETRGKTLEELERGFKAAVDGRRR